jgi:hypothetical protein
VDQYSDGHDSVSFCYRNNLVKAGPMGIFCRMILALVEIAWSLLSLMLLVLLAAILKYLAH